MLPGLAQHLDPQTLVIWVVAGKVAVGLQADGGVSTLKQEFFPVAHGRLMV